MEDMYLDGGKLLIDENKPCLHIEKAKKYLELARYNAELFSKDPNTKVGAIILTPDFSRVLSTGINGFPRKFNDEQGPRWERPMKYNYVSHAECNSVCNAARSGTSIDDSVIVVTMFPCMNCTKLLIQAGIIKVYSPKPDMDSERWASEFKVSLEMLKEVGIEIIYL